MRLGAGPAIIVTPYVPDLHHCRGSYGAKDVMPFHRDPFGEEPNITSGLLATLSDRFAVEISAADLLAYVYA